MTRLVPASDVAVIQGEAAVYVARLPGGPIAVLEGVAALIWTEACAGALETLVDRVESGIEPPVEGIDGEIDEFVAALLDRGLLRVLAD